MNYTNFTLPGGFPLEQDRFAFLQQAYVEAFAGIATFLGGSTGLVVLSGCVQTGIGNTTTVSDGIISYNGEIMPFLGGTLQSTFKVTEQSEPLQGLVYMDTATGNTQTHYPQRKRWASFGVGAGAIAWNPIRLEQSVANFMQTSPYITHGSVNVGNIGTPGPTAATNVDSVVQITFPTPISQNYMVVGTLVSLASTGFPDVQVTWVVRDLRSVGFELWVREVIAGNIQNLRFDYQIMKR